MPRVDVARSTRLHREEEIGVDRIHRWGEHAKARAASGQNDASAELTALNRAPTGLLLRALASAAIVLIVIDMIWKPGA